eukprot:5266234-Pleurochrysis_carterae.AAC.2
MLRHLAFGCAALTASIVCFSAASDTSSAMTFAPCVRDARSHRVDKHEGGGGNEDAEPSASFSIKPRGQMRTPFPRRASHCTSASFPAKGHEVSNPSCVARPVRSGAHRSSEVQRALAAECAPRPGNEDGLSI